MLRWLTFCSAHDGHRATQEQAKNWPKRPKNGPKLAIFGCASKRRDADSERSERQHHPCYTKAPSSPVPPGGFQGAEMADVLLRSRRSLRHARTGQNGPKTGQNWPFFAARASGKWRTASEARGSSVPAIRKPHLALCHPGGSRVLRWLTFCSAQDGHRATQKQAKNWPKRAKTGHFWLRERAASGGQRAKREASPSLLYESPIQPCATRGVPGC